MKRIKDTGYYVICRWYDGSVGSVNFKTKEKCLEFIRNKMLEFSTEDNSYLVLKAKEIWYT